MPLVELKILRILREHKPLPSFNLSLILNLKR
eukprot:COSAG05_NODE_9634_length_610_cov_48.320939_1_plen_31_part_10